MPGGALPHPPTALVPWDVCLHSVGPTGAGHPQAGQAISRISSHPVHGSGLHGGGHFAVLLGFRE